MTDVQLDPAAVRRDQAAIWDAVSAGWNRWREEFESAAVVASRRLVQLAGIGPGAAVLDFGCGIGEPTLTAAATAGPTGNVQGVDLSERMIAAARERAGDRRGVRFAVGDVAAARAPAGGFDAVLSRWALPFAADRVATLRELAGVLRPGGVLAAAVWAAPMRVPIVGLGFATISRHLRLDPPPSSGPSPFALADPDLLAENLTAGGFVDVTVEELTVPFRLPTPEAFARFTADVLPPGMRAVVRERTTPDSVPGLWSAVADAARERAGPDGSVDLTSVTWCVRGAVRGGAR